MITKVHCDICYGEIKPYQEVTLLSSYATKNINHLCPSCEIEVGQQLTRLRLAVHGWYARMLKVWMRNKRKSYTRPGRAIEVNDK